MTTWICPYCGHHHDRAQAGGITVALCSTTTAEEADRA